MNQRALRDFCLTLLRAAPEAYMGESATFTPLEKGEDPDLEPRVDGPAIRVRFTSEESEAHEAVFYLTNLYRELTQTGDFSEANIANALRFLLGGIREQARAATLPGVAQRERLCAVVDTAVQLPEMLHKSWGDLVIIPVVDGQTATRRLLQRDLPLLGMTAEEVVRMAVDQTRAHLAGMRLEVGRLPGNRAQGIPEVTVVSLKDDTYTSSLLLHPEHLARAIVLQPGDLFGLPSRSVLALVRGGSPLARRAMRHATEGIFRRSPYPRSPYLYRYDPDGPRRVL